MLEKNMKYINGRNWRNMRKNSINFFEIYKKQVNKHFPSFPVFHNINSDKFAVLDINKRVSSCIQFLHSQKFSGAYDSLSGANLSNCPTNGDFSI